MRKIIRFFLNYIFVSATTINVIACRWGCTNNDYDLADENEQDISFNFSDLQNQINTTNLGKTYTNVNWDTLINSSTINATEKAEIKDKLVRFYNIFAQIYGKKNVLKLLYRVAKINKNGLFGFVKSGYVYDSQFQNYSLVQVMAINPNSLSKRTQYWQYVSSYKASKSIIRTIVHEYGHALGSFIRLNFQGKQRINSLADNDPKKWWNNYFNSSYLLKDNLEKGEITFNYVEKYGWPKIIHQFTLKILFLIKNLLKVTLFSVKIL
ncbi:hypothetical protein [Spiroplasma endosymbiont of Amphimallon solstitiale]|uniref:hypothetical protein n=1 Tax=Spiroplasma endosymbiont of Amphimallon solstitiale TaxID=3066288 RepID=UPI00313ADF48